MKKLLIVCLFVFPLHRNLIGVLQSGLSTYQWSDSEAPSLLDMDDV